jgi:glycosyltransferase involved in cell wall biosynthesis
MDQASTLSVILPNYNHGLLLPRATRALLAQERPPDEIIVVDDGSSDNSRAVIEELASANPKLRVLWNGTNRGAIPTLNRGIEAARSRYVYLAAADDWIMPGFFKLALEALERNPSCGLFCGESLLVDGRTNHPTGVRPPARPTPCAGAISSEDTQALLKRIDNFIVTNSCVFRRDCIVAAGSLDETLGPFADGIMARKIALTHGFYFVPRIVACWAVYPESYSRQAARDLDLARSFLDRIPARLAADPAFPPWYADMFAKRWRFATSRLALDAEPVDHERVLAMVLAMGARSRLDRLVLRTIRALPGRSLARVTTLAWLALRLHPISLVALARTALARRLGPSAGRPQTVSPP